ncbi:helix-turn-helix transcriptional regulator [Streptomyces indicus]|uniref:HTH luxR-type domain-containing protein n=1 Tax=Streptomyces indicus TaxID=417292 RepID=A0A1G9IU29_9ACTN|nr:hypothetical protein [Streptomyces indicus]SDL28707.1 hypothetical protein SAMN05421806_12571 [Streptomyces indicus]
MPHPDLTDLDLRIIRHCAAGVDRKDSARLLDVNPARVNMRIRRACRLLGLPHRQVLLVAHCLRAGLIKPPVCQPVLLAQPLRDVLLLLDAGLSDVEIAARVCLSLNGVKSRVAVLLRQLGAVDRTHAVAIGYGMGLLGAEQTESAA